MSFLNLWGDLDGDGIAIPSSVGAIGIEGDTLRSYIGARGIRVSQFRV